MNGNITLLTIFNVSALDQEHPFISSRAPFSKDKKEALKEEIILIKQLSSMLRDSESYSSDLPKVHELYLKVKKSCANFKQVADLLDAHVQTILKPLNKQFKRSQSSSDLTISEKGDKKTALPEEEVEKPVEDSANDRVRKRRSSMRKSFSSLLTKNFRGRKEELVTPRELPVETKRSDSSAETDSNAETEAAIEDQLLTFVGKPETLKSMLDGPFKTEFLKYVLHLPDRFATIFSGNLDESCKDVILESLTYAETKQIFNHLKPFSEDKNILSFRNELQRATDAKVKKEIEGLISNLVDLGKKQSLSVKTQYENAGFLGGETLTSEELKFKIQIEKVKTWTAALKRKGEWDQILHTINENPYVIEAVITSIMKIENKDLRSTILDRLFESSGIAVVSLLKQKYLESHLNLSTEETAIMQKAFSFSGEIGRNIQKIKKGETQPSRADNTLDGASLREFQLLRETLLLNPERIIEMVGKFEKQNPPLYHLFKPATYLAHLLSVEEKIQSEPADSPYKNLDLTNAEKVAIYGYSLGDYEGINKVLRVVKGGEVNTKAALDAFKLAMKVKYQMITEQQLDDYISAVKSGMLKLPALELKEGETVYRAIGTELSSRWEEKNFQNSKGIYKDYAFSSASVLPEDKRPGGWRLLQFKQRDEQDKLFQQARFLGPLAALREREVLFLPGQEFEIVKENDEFVRPKLAETGYILCPFV